MCCININCLSPLCSLFKKMSSNNSRPKLIVFDLDYTLWPFLVYSDVDPPFKKKKNGQVIDRSGQVVEYYPEVPEVLQKLKKEGYTLAVASRTDEIRGANQLLDIFKWNKYFQYKEIYPGCKVHHFNEFKKQSGIAFDDMLFFDDEHRNICDLTAVGVTSILVTNGVSLNVVQEAINKFSVKKK